MTDEGHQSITTRSPMRQLAEHLAESVQQARIQAGKSPEEVSELVGMPACMVLSLERGQYSPSLDELARIAEALGARIELVRD